MTCQRQDNAGGRRGALNDLEEEVERALQVVERRALTVIDPNDASRPADVDW